MRLFSSSKSVAVGGAGGIERDPLKDNRAILEVRLTTLERAISEALRASLDDLVEACAQRFGDSSF